jgi:phosphatidylserine decarboxylase
MKYPLRYIHRASKQECVEKVYGARFLEALYGTFWLSRIFSFLFLPLFSRVTFFSHLYGWLQKTRLSRCKIKPFIQNFQVDSSEFLEPVSSFQSFNDFFIRKLKPEARPITPGNDVAILPADARYLVYENIHNTPGFWVKGHKFCLVELLQDRTLAEKYAHGSMVIARLAPVDYHRYHFPMNCLPQTPQEIKGHLYSVNPIALKRNIEILTQNKRVLTKLQTKNFGTVLYIDVGATYVGTIHQTFIPGEPYAKGDEKGYFSFGGSCLILIFEPGRIQFDQDLIDASKRHIEVLGHMGQSLGRALRPL